MKTVKILVPIFLGSALHVHAQNVSSPVVDGMILHLGDYVQQVEVRAKSLGPGGCAVTFSISGERNGFIAMPLIWSSWTKLEPAFFGSTEQTLNFSQDCETNAIAEVRYTR